MFTATNLQVIKKVALVFLLCTVGTGNAAAEHLLKYRWLMGESDPNVTGISLCEMGSCPTEAAASSGERLVLTGVGTLSIKTNGRPRAINGGGDFSLRDRDNNLVAEGKWDAKQLLMFDNYDGSDLAPANFRAGRMLARIRLKPHNGKAIRAVVELGCRIPGNSGIPGTIEGVRVYLDDGSGFVFPFDPRSTLFVDLN
jgi:hypothetical protein